MIRHCTDPYCFNYIIWIRWWQLGRIEHRLMYLSPLISAAHKQSNWRAVKNSLLQWNWCRKSPSQNSWGLCHPSSAGNPDWLCKHVTVVKHNIYHISACILKYIIQSFVYVWLMMRLSWKLVDGLGATFFIADIFNKSLALRLMARKYS